MSPTIRSASSSRPWMNNQRGLSGTLRRTSITATPSTAPTTNATRHPMCVGKTADRKKMAAAEPPAEPNQYEPLMIRSTRPRTRAGINSSIAEFTAEYSPPIPAPVKKRARKKNQGAKENAVTTVAAT